jgi:hypothetical protein
LPHCKERKCKRPGENCRNRSNNLFCTENILEFGCKIYGRIILEASKQKGTACSDDS